MFGKISFFNHFAHCRSFDLVVCNNSATHKAQKMKIYQILILFIIGVCAYQIKGDDKEKSLFRNLVKPFRMEKLNLIWIKAQQRLTEPKLQSLYTQMKIQDKEELQYKQNNKGNDKDGTIAVKLREKLSVIMRNYNLLELDDDNNKYGKPAKYDKYIRDKHENHNNKVGIFNDKRLNRLWNKAEYAGFTADELDALKKEFSHYQDKVDNYYNTLDEKIRNRYDNAVNQDELDMFNEVIPDKEIKDAQNDQIREQHRELKDIYDNLERKTAQGRSRWEFVEPKVIHLWNAAFESNFTAPQLAALKDELLHFESRLLKLSHLYAEQEINKKNEKSSEKMEHLEKNLKKQERKVEKLQETLEQQIYKHAEL